MILPCSSKDRPSFTFWPAGPGVLLLTVSAYHARGQSDAATPSPAPSSVSAPAAAAASPASAAVNAAPASAAAAPAATTVVPPPAPAASDDDLLVPDKPKTPAATAASDDDLLSPGPAKPAAQPSSDDDLLLPQGSKSGGSGAPAAAGEQGGVLFPDGPQRAPANLPPGSMPSASAPVMSTGDAALDHAKMLLADKYPSASICATCHPKQFREWSFSQHAYAQLSPGVQHHAGDHR